MPSEINPPTLKAGNCIRCVSPKVGRLRHAYCVEQCPSSGQSGKHVLIVSSSHFDPERTFLDLALQLLFLRASESMGNHDSNVVGAGRVG